MKKFLSIVLLLCIAATFITGCSDKGTNESNTISIDMDLSELSSMLVYSQVVKISEDPKGYIEKRIKINGQYYSSYFEPTKQYYHFVVVGDESLCCQAGLEFMWKGEHAYPDDYPEDKTEIQVVGVFGSYEELGKTYYNLMVDDISVLK